MDDSQGMHALREFQRVFRGRQEEDFPANEWMSRRLPLEHQRRDLVQTGRDDEPVIMSLFSAKEAYGSGFSPHRNTR